jgi:hypothetical protein
MEKILKGTSPRQIIIIDITPDQLREIAASMEASGNQAMPLEYVQQQLTPNIFLQWKPPMSRMSYVQLAKIPEIKQGIARLEAQDTSEAFAVRNLNPAPELGNA